MAVINVPRSGGGFLGGLGNIFGALSVLPGMQWAKPLAAGIGAVNAFTQGGGGIVSNASGDHGKLQAPIAPPAQNIAQNPWSSPQDDSWGEYYKKNRRWM